MRGWILFGLVTVQKKASWYTNRWWRHVFCMHETYMMLVFPPYFFLQVPRGPKMPGSFFMPGRRWSWPPKLLGCRPSTWSTSTTRTWRVWGDRPERGLSWASPVKISPFKILPSTCLCLFAFSAVHPIYSHCTAVSSLHSSLRHNNSITSASCCTLHLLFFSHCLLLFL